MIDLKEGDFVMGMTKVGTVHGRVEHVMTEGGTLGTPGSEYALESMPPDNPAMSVKVYKEESEGKWKESAYSVGMMYADATKLVSLEGHIMDSEKEMAMYDSSIGKAYEGCGCPTCKKLNVNCENCPVCKKDMDKAYQDCGCETCKKLNVACKDCPKCSEEMAMGKAYENCGCGSCKALKMSCKDCKACSDVSKSYESEDEDMDKWDNMQKACWVGYEQRGMKEKGGRMVPNCVYVGKSEEVEKATSVSVGDHVTFGVPKPPDKTESAHGVVERVERSGTVKLPGTNESVEASSDKPVAVIRVYATDEKGKRTKTDRRVAKPVSSLRVSSDPIDNEKMYDMDDEMEKVSSARLQELVDTYNKNKEGDKRITVGTLQAVYRRGIGAYRTNPSSVRGSVSSPEQWAMGRVNAFMAGLRGRFPRKAFDLDLFPKGHPRSAKKSLFEGFGLQVNGPATLTEVFQTEKREFSEASRERMAEAGTAMPDGSFPIANRADLMNAIRAVGRAKDYNKAKMHIINRARALNANDMLPEDWRNSATKGMGQWSGSIFDLNPFTK